MSSPVLPPETLRILELARKDREAARKALTGLPLEAQVAVVCEAPIARRGELLELVPSPEDLVPAMPEAELCYTVKGLGLADASWILSNATTEQLIACVDLDAWSDLGPDPAKLGEWIAALAEAGEDDLLRAAHALDPELLVLWLAERIEVTLRPPVSEADAWEPPVDAFTLEGQFWLRARKEKDDLSEVRAMLDVLFRQDYWRYFRLLQGCQWELPTETSEWALRWRSGRLLDLGFPSWEEAMAIYGVVPAHALTMLPDVGLAVQIGEWPLPIWMPRLPISASARLSLFRALASLPEHERRPLLYGFLALANRVAVADRMPLGDSETIPTALEKAAETTSRGLDHLSSQNGLDPAEVLRRLPLERLFRVGFTLSRSETR
jgi:hypothetical protein